MLDAIPRPADTCERSHTSTEVFGLAGVAASTLHVSTHGPCPLVLLDSTDAEGFGTSEPASV